MNICAGMIQGFFSRATTLCVKTVDIQFTAPSFLLILEQPASNQTQETFSLTQPIDVNKTVPLQDNSSSVIIFLKVLRAAFKT